MGDSGWSERHRWMAVVRVNIHRWVAGVNSHKDLYLQDINPHPKQMISLQEHLIIEAYRNLVQVRSYNLAKHNTLKQQNQQCNVE